MIDISAISAVWIGVGCIVGLVMGLILRDHVLAWSVRGRWLGRRLAVPKTFTGYARNRKLLSGDLAMLAYHDPLTGLPNRILFSDRLAQRLEQIRRNGGTLGVMFLDLDNFKRINDELGHDAGDRLLRQVGKRLVSPLRGVDTVARMGGDEFTVILGDIRSPVNAADIAGRLLQALSEPFVLDEHRLEISASIGISLYPTDGTDPETLVKNSDTAMYRAKQRGRDNYQFYSDVPAASSEKRVLLKDSLGTALDREEMLLYYQPRVDTCTGKICGAEALIRWQHPALGLVAPNQFIPIAEETGFIVPMTEWVLRQAAEQSKVWQDAGCQDTRISVNLSLRMLREENLVGTVKRILSESKIAPSCLYLEFAEPTLMKDPEANLGILRKLRQLGVGLMMDDFGSGYSSITYLRRLPLDAIKIDRSLIEPVPGDHDQAAVVRAVVAMAHTLGLSVIAEGVETISQLLFMRELSCDEIQGYFISRPVPAEEFIHSLQLGYYRSDDARYAA